MEYTSYERLTSALQHKEADRVPLDLGGALVTAISIHTLRDLRARLGLPQGDEVPDTVTQAALPSEDLRQRLKVDVVGVGPLPPSGPGLAKDLGLQAGHYRLIDEFGMGWQMPENGGHYYDLYLSPLKRSGGSKTWHRAVDSSLRRSTSSKRACRWRTSSPGGKPCKSTQPTDDIANSTMTCGLFESRWEYAETPLDTRPPGSDPRRV